MTENIEEQRALFTADRVDHVANKIAPALRFVQATEGFVVLQNRCILSAAAYQPRGDGDEGLLETIEAEQRVAPMPDVIVVLDLSVEVALDRIARAGAPDVMERHERLAAARERYRRLCELLLVCRMIDAADEPDNVASRVYAALASMRMIASLHSGDCERVSAPFRTSISNVLIWLILHNQRSCNRNRTPAIWECELDGGTLFPD